MWWIVCIIIAIAFPPAIVPMGIYLFIMFLKMSSELNSSNNNNCNKQQNYDIKKNQDESIYNYNLGNKYYFAEGADQDYYKAFQFFKIAADQGHVSAQFNLGIMYKNGEGIQQDDKKAFESYLKAAENGHAGAQNNLGIMYKNGEGVAQDSIKAVEWYTKSAENGNENGQYNLGVMYNDGNGVVKDIKKATELFKKAAERGHELAKNRLENINKKINIETLNNKSKKLDVNKMQVVKDSKNGNYKNIYTKVAGVTMDDRQEKVKNLHKGQSLMLYREPFNSYDKNAVAIYAGNNKIGYLNKEIASNLAALLDNGTSYYCEVSEVTGGNGYNYGVNIKLEEMNKDHLYKFINNNIDKMFYDMISNKNDQQMIVLASDVLYRCINPYIITDSDKHYVKRTLTNQNVDSFGAMCSLALMSYFINYRLISEYKFKELHDDICIKITSYIKHETFKTEFVQYTWKVQELIGLSTVFYNGLVDYCIGRTKQINDIVIDKFYLKDNQTKTISQFKTIQNSKANYNSRPIRNYDEDEHEENYYYTLDEDEKQDYDDWLEYVDNHN